MTKREDGILYVQLSSKKDRHNSSPLASLFSLFSLLLLLLLLLLLFVPEATFCYLFRAGPKDSLALLRAAEQGDVEQVQRSVAEGTPETSLLHAEICFHPKKTSHI